MTIEGIIGAIIIGLIIGALGRLIVPGKQNIPIWLTILVGIVAALIGSFIVGPLRDTDGIDWVELLVQVIAGRRRRLCGGSAARSEPFALLSPRGNGPGTRGARPACCLSRVSGVVGAPGGIRGPRRSARACCSAHQGRRLVPTSAPCHQAEPAATTVGRVARRDLRTPPAPDGAASPCARTTPASRRRPCCEVGSGSPTYTEIGTAGGSGGAAGPWSRPAVTPRSRSGSRGHSGGGRHPHCAGLELLELERTTDRRLRKNADDLPGAQCLQGGAVRRRSRRAVNRDVVHAAHQRAGHRMGENLLLGHETHEPAGGECAHTRRT